MRRKVFEQRTHVLNAAVNKYDFLAWGNGADGVQVGHSGLTGHTVWRYESQHTSMTSS